MSNSFFKSIYGSIIFLIIIVLFISIFFIPVFADNVDYNSLPPGYSIDISNTKYVWPSPGYTGINSYYGRRNSPTAGASSFHKGLDIGAPQGSSFVAVTSGKITYTGFFGGGGYTITLSSGNMKFTYCHVSPNYIVSTGQTVKKGDIIRLCWA